MSINLQELNQIRKRGFRPQAVGCFLHEKKILFVYKKKYKLWLLPQGGIDNQETIEDGAIREMKEELSGDFVNKSRVSEVVGRDKVEFTKDKWGDRELHTDDGEEILMKGKIYFFVAFDCENDNFDVDKTEFSDFKWLDYDGAMELTKEIYQKGKQRITKKVLNNLKEKDLL